MYKYLLAFTIPLSVYISLVSQNALCWLALFYSFVMLPLLDFLILESKRTLPFKTDQRVSLKWSYELLLYLAPFIQLFLIFTFLEQVKSSTPLELIGKILALGISCGAIGINIGHELGHRSKLMPRLTSIFLLSTSLYAHFHIEHNKGHHRRVGTEQDPATARLGESLYAFIIRSMTGCLKSALHLDRKLFITLIFFQLMSLVLIFYFYGTFPTLVFTAAAFFGAINLEIVNYIEHYGLIRKVNSSGRYEKVTPMHSWNSNHPIGRTILFELPRHSDHHAFVSKHYYELENYETGPQLPAGYSAMMVLATVPPLFFRVMNPKVKSYRALA